MGASSSFPFEVWLDNLHKLFARYIVKTIKCVIKLKKKGRPIPKGAAQEICKFLDFYELFSFKISEKSVRVLQFYDPATYQKS